MVKNSDKDRLIEPVLVKNTYKDKNGKSYINIAPFYAAANCMDLWGDNPLENMGEYLGKIARFIATLPDIQGAIAFESQSEMVYTLFNLEEGLKKCSEVNM